MRDTMMQILGLTLLVVPLVAAQWALGGSRRRDAGIVSATAQRWRVEIYSNHDDVAGAVIDRSDIPFPIKQVASARGRLAQESDRMAWALPRLELEYNADDPFGGEILDGVFGPDHRIRFISGNEAVLDAANQARLRLRAIAFR